MDPQGLSPLNWEFLEIKCQPTILVNLVSNPKLQNVLATWMGVLLSNSKFVFFFSRAVWWCIQCTTGPIIRCHHILFPSIPKICIFFHGYGSRFTTRVTTISCWCSAETHHFVWWNTTLLVSLDPSDGPRQGRGLGCGRRRWQRFPVGKGGGALDRRGEGAQYAHGKRLGSRGSEG